MPSIILFQVFSPWSFPTVTYFHCNVSLFRLFLPAQYFSLQSISTKINSYELDMGKVSSICLNQRIFSHLSFFRLFILHEYVSRQQISQQIISPHSRVFSPILFSFLYLFFTENVPVSNIYLLSFSLSCCYGCWTLSHPHMAASTLHVCSFLLSCYYHDSFHIFPLKDIFLARRIFSFLFREFLVPNIFSSWIFPNQSIT